MQSDAIIAHWLPILENVLPVVVIVLLSTVAMYLVVVKALDVLDFRRLEREKAVFIEITPPALTDKTLEATSHLFLILHGLDEGRAVPDKLLRHKVTFAAEVVASRERGIRFVMRVAEGEAETFEKEIVGFLPDAKLRRIDDYLPVLDGSRLARERV